MKKHITVNRSFLKKFTEKFGRTLDEKVGIMKCNSFYIDYCDSIGTLYYTDLYDEE